MADKKNNKSAAAWLNDWRVHVGSGAVLVLSVIVVLGGKRIGGENRRAARPMNRTHGAQLDGEFKPRSATQSATGTQTSPAAMNDIQREAPAAVGTSVAIPLDPGWLSDLPAVANPALQSNQPLQLIPGASLALAIQLPDAPTAATPLEIQIGSVSLQVRATATQSSFVCRGQTLGKLPNADGKLVLLVHRENSPAEAAVDAANGAGNVLRWVLAAGADAVAGRVELDGWGPEPALRLGSPGEVDSTPTVAAARFGSLPNVPEVPMPAVRFSR